MGRRRVLDLKRASVCVASSHGRDEHLGIVANVLRSQEDEISPANVAGTKRKGDLTVGSALRGLKGKSILLSVSLELKL